MADSLPRAHCRRLLGRKRRLMTAAVATMASGWVAPFNAVASTEGSSRLDNMEMDIGAIAPVPTASSTVTSWSQEALWTTSDGSSTGRSVVNTPESSSPSRSASTTMSASAPQGFAGSRVHSTIDINSIIAHKTPPRLMYPRKALTAFSSGELVHEDSSMGVTTALPTPERIEPLEIALNKPVSPPTPSSRSRSVSNEVAGAPAALDLPLILTTSIASLSEFEDVVGSRDWIGSSSDSSCGSGSGSSSDCILLPPIAPTPTATQFEPPLPSLPVVTVEPIIEETMTPMPLVPVNQDPDSPSPVVFAPSPIPDTTSRAATVQPSTSTVVPATTTSERNTHLISPRPSSTNAPMEERPRNGGASGSGNDLGRDPSKPGAAMERSSSGAGSHRFERGDTVVPIDESSGSAQRVVLSPSHSPLPVVPGDSAGATSTDAKNLKAYTVLRYAASVVAFGSLLWLVVSQVLGTNIHSYQLLDSTDPLRGPNRWEFGLFTIFVQGVGSVAHVAVTPGVPSYLLAFADAFSWTSFQPIHKSSYEAGRRRLDQVVLDGLVAFATRIGFREDEILVTTCEGVFLVLFILAAVFIVVLCIARRWPRLGRAAWFEYGESDTAYRSMVGGVATGIIVCLWMFALYPLALMSSFEIAMEARSSNKLDLGAIAVATAALGGWCVGGLIVSIMCVRKLRSPLNTRSARNAAVWKVVCDGVRVEQRLFFVVVAVAQIARGIAVGTIVRATTQLAVLISVDLAVTAAVLVTRPFEPNSPVGAVTLAVFGLRVATTALLFTFSSQSASSYPVRHAVGTVLMMIYVVVGATWFARHVWIAWRLVSRQHTALDSDSSSTSGYGDGYHAAVDVHTPSPSSESDAFAYGGAYARFVPDAAAGAKRIPYSGRWDELI